MWHVVTDKYMTVGPENEFGCRRIKALCNFGDVREGDIGGWIQNEFNLSDRGHCWLGPDSMALGKVRIKDGVQIHGEVIISGESELSGDAIVNGHLKLKDVYITDGVTIDCNGNIEGSEFVGRAGVRGNVELYGIGMSGRTEISGDISANNVKLYDNAILSDNVQVVSSTLRDECHIGGNSIVKSSELEGKVNIDGKSHVYDCCCAGHDIEIINTDLEGETISGTACYRDGENIQAKYENKVSDILPSDIFDSPSHTLDLNIFDRDVQDVQDTRSRMADNILDSDDLEAESCALDANVIF